MPSINMKLEMVTIIACEVDAEVFTSDKMQVRAFLQKIPRVTFEPAWIRLMPWLCAAPRKCMHGLRYGECRIFFFLIIFIFINGSR